MTQAMAWYIGTSWLDRRLEIRESPLHGRGTFAGALIVAGEIVTIWEHRILFPADVPMAPAGKLWPRADGTHVWLPPDDPVQPEHFLNHSCDPNVWMRNEVTLEARRDVAAGDELTADYALWELDPCWVSRFRCRCGVPACRGTVTGRDWQSSELQRRYAGHFHPILQARMAAQQ